MQIKMNLSILTLSAQMDLLSLFSRKHHLKDGLLHQWLNHARYVNIKFIKHCNYHNNYSYGKLILISLAQHNILYLNHVSIVCIQNEPGTAEHLIYPISLEGIYPHRTIKIYHKLVKKHVMSGMILKYFLLNNLIQYPIQYPNI